MKKRSSTIAVIIFIAGIGTSSVIARSIYKEEVKHSKYEFKRHVDSIVSSFESNIARNITSLLLVKGLYEASSYVSREEFQTFVKPIQANDTGLKVIQWVPRVSKEKRASYEESARKDGNLFFQFTEFADGKAERRRDSKEYYPVYFMAPYKSNEDSLGLDLASKKEILSLMQQSRDSGSISSILLSPDDKTRERALLVLIPFYRGPDSTTEERRTSLEGFISGILSMEISESLKANKQMLSADFNISLAGTTQEEKEIILSSISTDKDSALCWESTYIKNIEAVPGQRLKLSVTPTVRYLSEYHTPYPFLLIFTGFSFTIIAALYIHRGQRQRETIEKLVEERTAKLNSFSHNLRILHGLQFKGNEDMPVYFKEYLSAGRSIFGLSTGIIGNISGDTYSICAADSPIDIKTGTSFPLQDTFCQAVLEKRETVSYSKIGDDALLSKMPIYKNFKFESYICTPIITGKDLFGTLVFASESKELNFEEEQKEMLEIMAKDIGVFIERRHEKDILLEKSRELEETLEKSEVLREEANESMRAAEKANAIKSDFLNTISHELRTPLTVMLGNLPLLSDMEDLPDPDEIVEIAEDMERSGNHLLTLINDLLDLSKIEAGKVTLEIREFDLKKLLSEIYKTAESIADIKEKKITVIKEGNTPDKIYADEFRLRQILFNLVSNAVKATDSGEVAISVFDRKDYILFRVQDNGCGINSADLPFVFDSFRQSGSSDLRRGGTGLGLAITKKLVEMHRGKISVESVFGEGTIFEFSIPVRLA